MTKQRRLKILLVIFSCTLLFGHQIAKAGFEDAERAFRSGEYSAALKEWTSLADDGDTRAMIALGRMYLHGWGIEQNFGEARRLFDGAVKGQNLDGLYELGNLENKRGFKGHAVDWWRRAAERGHAEGQSAFAQALYLGMGVPKDAAAAFSWELKAANQGRAFSQLNVASRYARGVGTQRNLVAAYMWLTIAMEFQGELSRSTTQENRQKYAFQMTPAEIEQANRFARAWLIERGKVRPQVLRAENERRFPSEKLSQQNLDTLLLEARSLPNASWIPFTNNQFAIESPHKRILFFFTRKGHPAHPAAVIWRVVQQANGLGIELEGYYAGSERLYRRYLKAHRDKLRRGGYIRLKW